jgi:hypothetical protein
MFVTFAYPIMAAVISGMVARAGERAGFRSGLRLNFRFAPLRPLVKSVTLPYEYSGVLSSFNMFVGCFDIYNPPSFTWHT